MKLQQKLPLRVRSAIKVVGFFLMCAVGATVVFGWSAISKLLATITSFFALILLFEYWTATRPKRVRSRVGEDTSVTQISLSVEGFVKAGEGNWWERSIDVLGESVKLRLPSDDTGYNAALPFANQIGVEAKNVGAAWLAFKEGALASQKSEEYRRDVAGLKLRAFEFFAKKQPQIAEVILSGDEDISFWTCIFENGEFRDLSREE